ncbi:DNA-3-methyladenine glycosylase I [Leeia oryzae]|uniref:DNA-3-methyladenine glycosylase I n=1 Tax=Leeia oryzae TaxID=356662 RepID=UPI0003681152|nr:DNA-3-methyladenine glycosylase I [Leeia oryzae]
MTSHLHRCGWVNLSNPRYVDYHDQEWGIPSHDDRHLFEMLILEGAQAGLSWETVLNKRDSYRAAFDGFAPETVATYNDDKVIELLNNPGIIRNRLKVASAIRNANAFMEIQAAHGSFDAFIWRYVDNQPIVNRWDDYRQAPAKTILSDQISKDLTKKGFKFVGSTIMYSFMQAVGMINDHEQHCHCATREDI